MDSYIEEKAGMTVSEIFEKYGEEKFRDMEHDACVELAGLEGLVIASGGGAFTFKRNVEAFKGKDKIVFLDVPLGIIKSRLKQSRPNVREKQLPAIRALPFRFRLLHRLPLPF